MSIKEKVDAMTKIIRMTPVPVLLASLESMINILHERGIDVVSTGMISQRSSSNLE